MVFPHPFGDWFFITGGKLKKSEIKKFSVPLRGIIKKMGGGARVIFSKKYFFKSFGRALNWKRGKLTKWEFKGFYCGVF